MIKMILQYPLALVAAVVLHLVIVGLFLFHVEQTPDKPKSLPPSIQAVAIQAGQYQEQLKQAVKKKQQEKQRQEEKKQKQVAAKKKAKAKKRAAEKKRIEEKKRADKKARDEAKKKKAAAEKKAEALRLKKKKADQLAKKKKEDKKKKEIALKKKQEKEKKAKKKAKKLAEKKKAEKKAKRLLAEKKKKAEAKKRKEQQAREDEMLEMMAEEEAQTRLSLQQKEISKYKGLYQRLIGQKFRPPAAFPKGVCTVRVKLLPSGSVVDVTVARSSGNALFDAACKKAFHKASPFPVPKDQALFNREFRNMTIILDPGK